MITVICFLPLYSHKLNGTVTFDKNFRRENSASDIVHREIPSECENLKASCVLFTFKSVVPLFPY